jgi:glycosyltransferase
MKVSIITATYNSLENLPSALESVSQQTYKNIEWIVVDGNSTDGTLAFIKSHQDQIGQWVSEKDAGIYDALNKGIAMATGDVIGLLHSDDLFNSKQTLDKIIHQFQNTGADGVYGDLEYVSKTNVQKVIRYWKSKTFSKDLLEKGWMPPHPTLFLKKEIYQKCGGFDLSFKIAADYDFILRIFSDPQLKFTYLPEVITKMRVGGASNKSLSNIAQKSKEDYRALKQNKIPNASLALFKKNQSKISQFFKNKD